MDPATMTARIYLTTDTADFLHYRSTGALAPRSVQEAAAFPLDVAGGDPDSAPPASAQQQKAIMEALETIFVELNDEPTQQWAQDYRAAGNRSLSVGDVVVLGEAAWVVAPVGFERISSDDLATAMVPVARDERVSGADVLDADARQWAQAMAERVRGRSSAAPARDRAR